MVTVAGQSSAPQDSPQFDFQSLIKPAVVDRMQPESGPVGGGTLLVVSGSGFGTGAAVFLVALARDGVTPTGARAECLWRNSSGESIGGTPAVCGALITAKW